MPQTNQNKVGILFPNLSSPIYDSLYPLGDRPNSAWILTKATQYGAKLALYPQYPRPTGEVSSFSSHLFAHSTMTYELYPKAFGGCWPYRWSLITGPAGMAIGNELDRTSDSGLTLHTVGSSYGKVTWAGAKSGSHSVVIRCTDQLGSTVDFSFTLTVDDTKFVFLDASAADDSGSGTLASPKKTFAGAFTSGFTGRTMVLRTGTYTAADVGLDVGFAKATRPTAMINYPGETPVIDCSSKLFRDGAVNGAADDLLVRGINFDNARGSDDDVRVLHFTAQQQRMTFQKNTFSNIPRGATAGDNPGCITVFQQFAGQSNHLTITDNTLTSTALSSLSIWFTTDRVLFESNTAANNATAKALMNAKDSTNNVCVRNNKITGVILNAGLLFNNQTTSGTNQECCWNTVVGSGGAGINWNQQRITSGGGPYWDYANSYRITGDSGVVATMFGSSNVTVHSNGNVIYGEFRTYDNGLGSENSSGFDLTGIANQVVTSAQIDTNGKLTGTGSTYRLTKGSELYS